MPQSTHHRSIALYPHLAFFFLTILSANFARGRSQSWQAYVVLGAEFNGFRFYQLLVGRRRYWFTKVSARVLQPDKTECVEMTGYNI